MPFNASVDDRRRPLRALLARCCSPPWRRSRVARDGTRREERLPLIDKTESLGPGITLHHLKSLGQSGWQDEQVLTVHLNEAGVSTNLLTAGAVAKGGPLTEAANKAGAVAGVNGDFFDIGNSTAAEGGRGRRRRTGQVRQRQQQSPTTSASATPASPSSPTWRSKRKPNSTAKHPGPSINAADGARRSRPTGMVAYTPAWGTYSRARGFGGVTNVAEVLVVDDKVARSTRPAPEANQIPADGFALVGRDAGGGAICALTRRRKSSSRYGLSAAATKELQFAIGDKRRDRRRRRRQDRPRHLDRAAHRGGLQGRRPDPRARHLGRPRRHRRGRHGDRRRGAELAEEGVETAVNLDGGGSTTMVARASAPKTRRVRNTPSDGAGARRPERDRRLRRTGRRHGPRHVRQAGPARRLGRRKPRVFPGTHLDADRAGDRRPPGSGRSSRAARSTGRPAPARHRRRPRRAGQRPRHDHASRATTTGVKAEARSASSTRSTRSNSRANGSRSPKRRRKKRPTWRSPATTTRATRPRSSRRT